MKHDNHGCARVVISGGLGCLTLLASFFLLFLFFGFRAAPAERPPLPENEPATTLVVRESGPEGAESVETSSDGVDLVRRSRYRERDGAREELRLVWRGGGDVEPESSGVYDAGGERLRGLTDVEVRELQEWRVAR